MSKEKLVEARSLIQQKQYDAARAILDTLPNDPTARQWLTRLNQIAPRRETPVSQESKAQTSGSGVVNFLIAAVAVVILLILVGAGGYFAGQSNGKEQGQQSGQETAMQEYAIALGRTRAAIPPTQTATLAPSATPTDPPTILPEPPTFFAMESMTASADCDENAGPWWYDDAGPLVEKFFDTSETAMQTARMSLSGVVLSLQETQREFEHLDYPQCARDAVLAIRSGMGLAVDGFNSFLGEEADVVVNIYFELATQSFAEAYYEFEKVPAVVGDYRMIDASIVWGGASPDLEALTPSPEPQGARLSSTVVSTIQPRN